MQGVVTFCSCGRADGYWRRQWPPRQHCDRQPRRYQGNIDAVITSSTSARVLQSLTDSARSQPQQQQQQQ